MDPLDNYDNEPLFYIDPCLRNLDLVIGFKCKVNDEWTSEKVCKSLDENDCNRSIVNTQKRVENYVEN